MPSFSQPSSLSSVIKLLYLGHTGAGKTGSLCSLAAAGYRVRILDLDGSKESPGTQIISDYMTNPKSIYLNEKAGLWTAEQAKSAPSRISYVSIPEGFNIQGDKAIPRGDSWHKINMLLSNWIDGDDRPGGVSKWTSNDILVIDSNSRLCESAMNFQLSMNGRLPTGPQVGSFESNDYSAAYALVLKFYDLLKCDDIKCNVILICHIAFLEQGVGADKQQVGFPQVVGRKVGPMVGQYFNQAIRAKRIGTGPGLRRVIVTTNDESVDLKNSAPLRVKPQYDLATGLAEFFRDVKGGGASVS